MSACSYRGVESILRHRLDETAAEPLARTELSTTKFTRWSTNEGHPNRCSRTGESEVFNCEETTQGLLHWR